LADFASLTHFRWDALLNGEYENINESELPPKEAKEHPVKSKKKPDSSSEDEEDDVGSVDSEETSASGSDIESKSMSDSDKDSEPEESPEPILQRFRPRAPEIANTKEAKESLDAALSYFPDRFELRLHNSGISTVTGLTEGFMTVNGLVNPKSLPRKHLAFITYHLIEPLLDGRITAAERVLCQFFFAITIFHELGGVRPPVFHPSLRFLDVIIN
jgi:hypothetical protein